MGLFSCYTTHLRRGAEPDLPVKGRAGSAGSLDFNTRGLHGNTSQGHNHGPQLQQDQGPRRAQALSPPWSWGAEQATHINPFLISFTSASSVLPLSTAQEPLLLSPFSTIEFLITVGPVPGGPVGAFHLTRAFSFEIAFIHKTLYKWVRHTEINLHIDMYDYNFRAIVCIIKKNDMPSMLSLHKSEHFVPIM